MQLMRYVARRLLLLLPVLLGMSMLVFLLLRLIPGDPAAVILGLRATPERMIIVRDELGLDLPIHRQYWQWLSKLLQGDLGQDYRSNILVTTLLKDRLPVTIELTLLSLALSMVIAIPLQLHAAGEPRRYRRATPLQKGDSVYSHATRVYSHAARWRRKRARPRRGKPTDRVRQLRVNLR